MPEIDDSKPISAYVRRLWRPFTLGTVTLALTNLFDILTPFALMKAIDAITASDSKKLHEAIGLYLLFMLGTVAFRYQWRLHFGKFHHSVAEDLRNRLFSKYTRLGPTFFEKNPTGELMSLMINDVNTFRMAVGPGLLILLDAFFLIIFIVPFMLSISVEWTWKTLILLPFIPFVIRFMENRIATASRDSQDRLSEMSGYTQELVTGIRVVKGFSQETQRLNSFRVFSNRFATASNRVAKYDAMFEPALQIGVATGSVILLAWGSRDVLSGAVTLGTFVAFHEYIKRMVWPMAAIGSGLSLVQQGRSSYARMAEVFQAAPDVKNLGRTKIARFESLRVENLTFTYPGAGHPALSNVSFSLRRGETLGIVGPVGSGKSTLVQILGGIRPAPEGCLFINGETFENLDLESWRARLAVAPQDAFLFSRTVAENILFGRDAATKINGTENTDKSSDENSEPQDAELLEAIAHADAVALREEIDRLPLGFRAWLGEKGVNLSGGQRQRMTIARALAHTKSADFVILDDSLSAVDGKTEASVLSSLRRKNIGSDEKKESEITTLIISHRLAAVAEADRILVLNQGSVEAIGTHFELLKLSPTYRRIHELQSETKSSGAEPKRIETEGTLL